MRMLKCSRCGSEVTMIQVANGYIGECCNEVHFHPRVEMYIPASTEEDEIMSLINRDG